MGRERSRLLTVSLSLVILVAIAFLSLPHTAFGFELKGFSDITFTYTDNKQDTSDPNTKGSFALGQFDLYVSQNIGERLDFLSELVVEGNSATGEFVVDLERLQIGYIFDDALKVRAGRFHNLLGYWNMAFHHGAQIQTTIERPEFLKFEDDGGILPVHVIGLWVGGRLAARPGALEYGVMVANGAKVKGIDPAAPAGELDPNSAGDNSKNKAVSFHLRWMPHAIRGLSMGVSGNFSQLQFFDLVTGAQIEINGSKEVAQGIYGVDLEYLAHNIEFLSELYQIRDHGTKTFLNYAWYVQGGYKIANRFTPYARFERMTVHEDDPYFAALGTQDLSKTIVGIRFDIIPSSSLKAEVRFVNSTDNFQEYGLQWAFAF